MTSWCIDWSLNFFLLQFFELESHWLWVGKLLKKWDLQMGKRRPLPLVWNGLQGEYVWISQTGIHKFVQIRRHFIFHQWAISTVSPPWFSPLLGLWARGGSDSSVQLSRNLSGSRVTWWREWCCTMIYNLCLTLCRVDFRFVVAKPNLNDKMKFELLCSQPFGHCGFRNDHSVNLYTSPDLEQWTFAGLSCNFLK